MRGGERKFYLFSCGINKVIDEDELCVINNLFKRSKIILCRGKKEISLFSKSSELNNINFCPCPSLFSSEIFNIKPYKTDLIVLNLDSFLFTNDNYKKHPLRKFKEYAESLGLKVCSMVNGRPDINKYLVDIFPIHEIDNARISPLINFCEDPKLFTKKYNNILNNSIGFAHRYNGARFAFGKRLHGWLPFLSFNIPSAFIGIPTRRGFPSDYFTDDFLCDVPRNNQMTNDELKIMSDMMISKLNFFIKHEDILSAYIRGRRAELYDKFNKYFLKFIDTVLN